MECALCRRHSSRTAGRCLAEVIEDTATQLARAETQLPGKGGDIKLPMAQVGGNTVFQFANPLCTGLRILLQGYRQPRAQTFQKGEIRHPLLGSWLWGSLLLKDKTPTLKSEPNTGISPFLVAGNKTG